LPISLWRIVVCWRRGRRPVVCIVGWRGCRGRSGLAGVFGGGACKRHVDFLLGEVLGLEKSDALLERRARDGWILQDCSR
jgi:hypothetical protein